MKKHVKSGFSALKTEISDFSVVLRRFVTYKFILMLIALIMCGHYFSNYRSSVQKKINKNSTEYCKSVVKESIEKMDIRIDDEFTVLETLAIIYRGNTSEDIETTAEYYNEIYLSGDFESINAINAGKQTLISIGQPILGDLDEFYDAILDGENMISDIQYDDDSSGFICLGVPIYKNGSNNVNEFNDYDSEDEIIGALVCKYKAEVLTSIIDTSYFEEIGGNTLVAQADGTVIVHPDNIKGNSNLFNIMDSFKEKDKKTIEKIEKDIKGGRLVDGEIYVKEYDEGIHKRYICYSKVDNSDWYSLSIISNSAINKVAKKVQRRASKLMFQFVFIFVIYVIIVIAVDIKAYKKEKIEQNLKNTEKKDKITEKTDNNK